MSACRSASAPLRAALLLLAAAGSLAPARPLLADEADDESGFVSLFDGRTLDGWEGNLKYFRIVDGAIVAGNLREKIPNNEFLCSTRKFSDFELRLEARLQGQGDNAGVQFRSERIPNHHEVIGYQCDIGRMQDKPIWGWLYDESRRRKFLTEADPAKLKAVLKPDGWNQLTIRCVGPRVQIWVNGLQTTDYTETDDKIARQGLFGLQIHSGPPAEAAYRKIRIKELKDLKSP